MTPLPLLVLATLGAVAAELPPDWKHVQQLSVARSGLVKLSLPAETLGAARPGLEDLRILDSGGREVPYLIERPLRGTAVVRTPKEFTVALRGQTTVLTIETGIAQSIESLTLETPATNFIKAVAVDGSQDQTKWQPLVEGQPIFHQPNGASQLRVRLPAGVWPFLRVTIDDRRSEAVPFVGANMHAVAGEPAPADALPVTIAERIENDGQTRLTLDLGASQLTVAGLRVETSEPLFTRPVRVAVRQVAENAITERVLVRDTIYRVAIERVPSADRVDIPLDQTIAGRELLVLIDNGDSQPLQIAAVSATRRPVYAVFLAQQGGAYRVLTGNPRCAAPRYDVAALGGRLKGAPLTPLTLAALAANPAYRPSEPLPEIQDLGATLDTGEWTYRKRVELARAGVQQLDLDLEVLARAQPSLRDLRLVRDGKQRPYVLERTSIARKLVPDVSTTGDPKRPTVSRWLLKLPHRNLPLTRLTCASSTGLFRRQVRLYEQPTDERGEKYERRLGEASWVRTPPATKAALELWIGASPLTDTLILETDNGDNPAIELEKFQFFYPVTRVLFKAPLEPATYLYYGNRGVGLPHYDLDLIAPRLLPEEKAVGSLAPEEELKPSAFGEMFQLAGTKSIVFWVALALVVVVLLVVIARLLPKSPTPES